MNNKESVDFYESEEIVKCYKDCPHECDINEYKLSSSYASYPNELYEKYVEDYLRFRYNDPNKHIHNQTDIKKSRLALNVVSFMFNNDYLN